MNALSIWCRAEIHRDGGVYEQEYKTGKPAASVKKSGASDKRGTIITFKADPAIFPEIVYDWNKIVSHLRQQAYLVKGLRISIIDAREVEKVADESVFYLRELGLEAPSMTVYF